LSIDEEDNLMMDPFTVYRMGLIRQQEILKQAAAMPDRTPIQLLSVTRWLKSVFHWVRLPKLPAPNRRRISRT
jgi:hypothetical protein